MRVFVAAVATLIFILSLPALASPTLHGTGFKSSLPAQPVAGGCGVGWHRAWCPRLGRYCCLPN